MKQPDKYEMIVRRYSEPLYWHIRRLVVCHEDAQDVLQDSLTSIYFHLWQVRDEAKIKAWVYSVATNKAYKFLRKKSRQLNDELVSEQLAEQLSETAYVDYEKAGAVDLQKAILSLPKQQQLVFNLRFYDEMDYEQISRITGTSVDSLRVNYHIARKKVEKYLTDEQI